LRLSFPQTILLDSALYDSDGLVPWFDGKGEPSLRITPLIQIFTQNVTERVAALQQINRASFLYAKVGTEDDFCFPNCFQAALFALTPVLPKPDSRQREAKSPMISSSWNTLEV